MRTLCIELTTQCPLRCVHCSASASPEGRTKLEVDRLTSYLAERAPLAEVYLSGGEPFAHPDFSRIVAVARGVASQVIAYSSGTSSSAPGVAPLADEALQEARAAGLDRIDLSLYAEDAGVHDHVTGTAGSFAATVETCRRMAAHRLPLGIHFVPVASEAGHLPGVARLARKFGATCLHVLALAKQGRAEGRDTALSARFLAELSELLANDQGFEVVASSALRAALGLPRTARDDLETGFVDARGFTYPAEGMRRRASRSLSTIDAVPRR